MIIAGITTRRKQIGQGEFFCPQCRRPRRYTLQVVSRYITLFFIPLIPLGEVGKFVACESCGMLFKPAVLEQGDQLQPAVERRPPDLAALINRLPDRLAEGTPVEYLARDLTAAGLDRERALDLIDAHLTAGRNTCADCQLTYAAPVSVCAECGQRLA
jgi:hypothetical protein